MPQHIFSWPQHKLVINLLGIFLILSCIRYPQPNMTIVRALTIDNFPNCEVEDPSWIGDEYCDGGEYNTEECGFDGGDCDIYNQYPNCIVGDPGFIGDGVCDGGEYNVPTCNFDAGDCTEFNTNYPNCVVENPSFVGDGECDGGDYNTEDCGFDGGDCNGAPSSAPAGSPVQSSCGCRYSVLHWRRRVRWW